MALSIDDLRSFLLVADERSVTRAAEHMGVSQQSVSERIRRLEHRVGVKLFNRLAYGMQPTAAGFRLLPYASQCVSLIDQALAVVDDDDLVRVKIQSSVSAAVMPHIQRLIKASSIKVSVAEEAAEIMDALAAGALDVGIGVFPRPAPTAPFGSEAQEAATEEAEAADDEPGESDDPGEADNAEAGASANGKAGGRLAGPSPVMVEGLFTDPVVWVAPPDHPLAKREGSLSLAELGVPGGLGSVEGGSAPSANGFQVVARSAVAPQIAAGQLVELPVENPGWVVPVSIAYRGSEHDRPSIVALRSAITEGRANASNT